MTEFDELVSIVAALRAEGGCPWDRAQTPRTLRPYLLEEAYELVDAIDRGATAEVRKEMGDVLFQVVLLATMAEQDGAFSMRDVLRGISAKMIARHPHVFDPDYVRQDDEGSIGAWEARKAVERGPGGSALDGVPVALPALIRAHRISEKAGMVGFDWPDAARVRRKLAEEIAELDEALAGGDPDRITDELGDVLFTVVNLGRHLPSGAEEALRGATRKFEGRFRALEAALQAEGSSVHATDPATLEARWQALKGAR